MPRTQKIPLGEQDIQALTEALVAFGVITQEEAERVMKGDVIPDGVMEVTVLGPDGKASVVVEDMLSDDQVADEIADECPLCNEMRRRREAKTGKPLPFGLTFVQNPDAVRLLMERFPNGLPAHAFTPKALDYILGRAIAGLVVIEMGGAS